MKRFTRSVWPRPSPPSRSEYVGMPMSWPLAQSPRAVFVLALDDTYVPLAGVMLCSFVEHSQPHHAYELIVLDCGLSLHSVSRTATTSCSVWASRNNRRTSTSTRASSC